MLANGKTETDREVFTRFLARTIKKMDQDYSRTIVAAKEANQSSLDMLENNETPENIEKLRALNSDRKEFMRVFRTKYYSQRPPRSAYAMK